MSSTATLAPFPFFKNLRFDPTLVEKDRAISRMRDTTYVVPCVPSVLDMREFKQLFTDKQLQELEPAFDNYRKHKGHTFGKTADTSAKQWRPSFSAVRLRHREGSTIGRLYPYVCVQDDKSKIPIHYMTKAYRENVFAALNGYDLDMVKAHPNLILAFLNNIDSNSNVVESAKLQQWKGAISYYTRNPDHAIQQCIDAVSGGCAIPIDKACVKKLFNLLSYGGDANYYLNSVLKQGREVKYVYDAAKGYKTKQVSAFSLNQKSYLTLFFD
jgi:hypothetical protein